MILFIVLKITLEVCRYKISCDIIMKLLYTENKIVYFHKETNSVTHQPQSSLLLNNTHLMYILYKTFKT